MNVTTGYGDCTEPTGVFSIDDRRPTDYTFTQRKTLPSGVVMGMTARSHAMPCSEVPVINARGKDLVSGPFAIPNDPAPRSPESILEGLAPNMNSMLRELQW